MNRNTRISFDRESNTAVKRVSTNDDRSYTSLGIADYIRHILDQMMGDPNNMALSVTVLFDEILEEY